MSDLIKVEKNGEVIEIAPSVVEYYTRQLGWKLVVVSQAPAEPSPQIHPAIERGASEQDLGEDDVKEEKPKKVASRKK